MDCPSEENLIRMKLDGISNIKNLEFDIPNRRLTVYHSGQIDEIEKAISDTGFNLNTEVLIDITGCPGAFLKSLIELNTKMILR